MGGRETCPYEDIAQYCGEIELMAVDFKDYYKILGVNRDADQKAIRQAYRKLARQYHPDVNPNDKTAEEKFKEINEANEVLSDPVKRQKYDEMLNYYQQYGRWPGEGAQAGAGRGAGTGGFGRGNYQYYTVMRRIWRISLAGIAFLRLFRDLLPFWLCPWRRNTYQSGATSAAQAWRRCRIAYRGYIGRSVPGRHPHV